MICPHCNKEISDHIWAVHMGKKGGRPVIHKTKKQQREANRVAVNKYRAKLKEKRESSL